MGGQQGEFSLMLIPGVQWTRWDCEPVEMQQWQVEVQIRNWGWP